MNDGRLTREQDRRMLELLEQAALHDYPNPERKGCPGQDFLKRLATHRSSIPLDDPRLTHVARCSPCYREFASYKQSARSATVSRRALVGLGGVLAASVAAFEIRTSHYAAAAPWVPVAIDLSRNEVMRGTASNSAALNTISLPPKRLDLTITLPFTSPEGEYQVEVLNSNGERTDINAAGTAYLKDGSTLLHVRLDLSRLRPDSYQIGLRRIRYDWVPVPIRVK